MYPQITVNISIHPDGVRVSEGTTEVEREELALPPVPVEVEEGADAILDEPIFAPPEPEEELDAGEEGWDIPPVPDE